MNLIEYLENIEKKLQRSFDIQRDYIINDYKYDFFAEYHLRAERYILVKKAVIDAMESNEYCLIKYFDSINQYDLQGFIDSLIEAIDVVVQADEGHMSSIITGVIVLKNKPSSDIIQIIEKFKYHKGFAFGFKGWVDIRLILVTMDEKYIVTNKKGKEVRKVYSI